MCFFTSIPSMSFAHLVAHSNPDIFSIYLQDGNINCFVFFDFTDKIDFSAIKTFEIIAFANLNNDQKNINDTAKKSIQNNNIIKEITTSKDYFPSSNKLDILMKRYQIWKDLYSSNKKIASNLIS